MSLGGSKAQQQHGGADNGVAASSDEKAAPSPSMLWAEQLRKYVGTGAGLGSEALTGERVVVWLRSSQCGMVVPFFSLSVVLRTLHVVHPEVHCVPRHAASLTLFLKICCSCRPGVVDVLGFIKRLRRAPEVIIFSLTKAKVIGICPRFVGQLHCVTSRRRSFLERDDCGRDRKLVVKTIELETNPDAIFWVVQRRKPKGFSMKHSGSASRRVPKLEPYLVSTKRQSFPILPRLFSFAVHCCEFHGRPCFEAYICP